MLTVMLAAFWFSGSAGIVSVAAGGAIPAPTAVSAPLTATVVEGSEDGSDTSTESGGEMNPTETFMSLYQHMLQHPYSLGFEKKTLVVEPPVVIEGITNHILVQLIAGFLLLLIFYRLARIRSKEPVPRGVFENVFESLVVWVRDELVYKTMGEKLGKRFLPLFLTQFFFILALNLIGLLPNFDFLIHLGLPTTATANISVTLALALVTFSYIHVCGIKEHGIGPYVKSWVPSGLGAINLILFPIEVLGHVVKPLALTIRLFANMTGGHMAILTIYGLIYFLSESGENLAVGFPVALLGLSFAVFLMLLELLVAFLQAFIFTYLSVIFIGAAIHPDH